ncbi:DUF998 domain-containing protein [Actinoplanes awajinensis]|uniref:DUF998 domain-containing protein n=1 Tax=Actinoplanes awajinensis subsp. mycoplanecinus TaxID=135947 RepID=A0A124G8Q2_9ACTN|nr:DUF998 domain-containing protein [Actinoplanes awajinensis]KUL26680.1 hypothetical protein ADL15_37325 [Actinoplanes awajinensis subsp. mycoplanecinus]
MSGSLLAVTAVVLLLAYLAIFVALHLRGTGYHLIRNAVSDYGVGRTAGQFRAAVLANSLGILALTGALAVELGRDPLSTGDYVILLLIPATRLALAFFPTDVEGTPVTATGRIHLLLAVASFTFVYLSVANLTPPLTGHPAWSSLGAVLVTLKWIAAAGLAAVVVTMVVPSLRRLFGLAERVYLLSTNLWFLLVALFLTIWTF